MTEAGWLASDDAPRMLRFVSGRAGERKVRLFAVGCCRHLGRLPTQVEFALALEASERFADGPPSKSALRRARQDVRSIRDHPPIDRGGADEWAALWLAEIAARGGDAARNLVMVIDNFVDRGLIPPSDRRPGPDLARCVFGNPFRPARLDAGGLLPTVVDLARAIYDDRAFDRLPILGDALEEAGCAEGSILDHCRGGGPHARGCWVVDLVLGRG